MTAKRWEWFTKMEERRKREIALQQIKSLQKCEKLEEKGQKEKGTENQKEKDT